MRILANIANGVLAVLLSAWVTSLLAAPITSVQNLLWLVSEGMPIDYWLAGDILLKDLYRFASVFFVLIGVSFALGFPVAWLIGRYVFGARPAFMYILYSAAAAVSMTAMLWALVAFGFETQLIGGNRSTLGKLLHAAAAGLGGLIFAKLVSVERSASFAIRVFALIPCLFMSWMSLSWIIDPIQVAGNMGLTISDITSDRGINLVMRDLSAFFIGVSVFILLAMRQLQYRWFLAAAIMFLFAGSVNLLATRVHGYADQQAMLFEFVMLAWMLLLAATTARYRHNLSGAVKDTVPAPEQDPSADVDQEVAVSPQL